MTPEDRQRARDRAADEIATKAAVVMTADEKKMFRPMPKCGTYARWQSGCRCRRCKDARNAANVEQQRRARARKKQAS